MTDAAYLGVDVGTSSTKGVLVDAAGTVLMAAQRPHEVSRPHPGHVEMEAAVWWQEFRELAVELAAPDGVEIVAVGVSGMGPCVVLTDEDDEPLRPAILYGVDTRATPQIAILTAELGEQRITQRCGSGLSTQAVGPKLAWLAEHEPETFARARRLFMPASWLGHRLTGEYGLDHHSASQCVPMYDRHRMDWHAPWADRVRGDIELPPLSWPGDVLGAVTKGAAAFTGLRAGTPVITGTIDAWSEAVSGATDRVRDELLAFASLQDRDGAIRRAPGVASHSYAYVPGFTEEHLLLGVHRYVCWTGDLEILDEPVTAADGTVRLQDRLLAAAGSLLARANDGLLAPCGWLDAWPPTVLAQAQVSMTGAEALEALASLLEARGEDPTDIAHSAARLRGRIDDVFLDRRTGLYAEHLFDEGVTGGSPDDFWSHTQISAVLSGQTRDPRGLDLVGHPCFRRGITGTTSRTLDAPYVAQSTDADTELELDSTATWMLATWPELTHRYALAEIALGRPDRALDAVTAQLPESLHASNPFVAPWYYAEKYLYPGDEPWLFTWGGDPTLVEVVLGGFFGLTATLDGIHVQPTLPEAWTGQRLEATLHWRGRRHAVVVDPQAPEPVQLTETTP